MRSGCRWYIRSSPSRPPAAALSAISASGTVNRPVACPAWMSRRARGARPRGMSRASRPAPGQGTRRCRGGSSRAARRSACPRRTAPPGSVMPALARSISWPQRSFSHLFRGGLEELLLAVEVVVERPEADVGLLGDLLDACRVPAALGDEPHRGVDEGLPGVSLTPVQPRSPRRGGCRCRLCHHCSSCRSAWHINGRVRGPPSARRQADGSQRPLTQSSVLIVKCKTDYTLHRSDSRKEHTVMECNGPGPGASWPECP